MNMSLSHYFYNTLGKQHKNEERLSFMLTAFSFSPSKAGISFRVATGQVECRCIERESVKNILVTSIQGHESVCV